MSNILATPAARVAAKEKNIDLGTITGTGKYGAVLLRDLANVSAVAEPAAKGVRITPVAKNAMAYYNVSADDVTASGNKITKQDVVNAATKASEAPAPAAKPVVASGLEEIVTPYKGMRKAVGENMMSSIHGSAQLSFHADIDTTDFMETFSKAKTVMLEKYGMKMTVSDFMMKAVGLALEKFPKVNAHFDGKNITQKGEVNIGLAVAQDGGLVVPVFKNIESKSIFDICEERMDIVPKARDNKLSGKYYRGATFTISNTGRSVMSFFTPIVNVPEIAILGVGRTKEMPAVVNGEIVVRTFTAFSITIDHRVLDGMDAVNFLNTLDEVLSNPINILL